MKIIAILDNIRSALNVGAIFRTCDAVGVEKLILGGITPAPPHPKIKKTALGADDSVKFEKIKDIKDAINKLKTEGYSIVAVELNDRAVKYFDFKPKKNIALIFGNELSGVSPEILEICDEVIYLPMNGIKESLNVSTTLGIVLYHYKYGKIDE